jgi:acyl-homoserine-lactone acylase
MAIMRRFSKSCWAASALALFVLAASALAPQGARAQPEQARWRAEAQASTIVRDNWGIAHVHGKTDADAVFAMVYAQAEDDFNRVETNYLNALGRLAEAEGEGAVYQDLREKLFIDPVDLKSKYAASPVWLQRLMDAWADGLNFYLDRHPHVTPRVIRHFEPWMALSFSEGSIGGDIESISVKGLEAFYGPRKIALATPPLSALLEEPSGSNGIAIAPSNTVDHHALLLINPHTSFFFRSELQMTSDEGLNAYGAATWGQFFLYQGFNERVGWMHTSTTADAIDEFAETIVKQDGKLFYRYGTALRPVTVSTIVVPYRAKDGTMASKTFTVFRTHHGPIVREADGKWISVSLMYKPIEALSQSYLLTKARNYTDYMKVMALKANSSNNTVYADADGQIAYLHPQFMPKRDDRFDYTKPVDGSDPATDWQGETALSDLPQLLNPPNGWIMNTNDWPYSAAGPYSPKRADFPRYMDTRGENPRGLHATRLLTGKMDFTLEGLRAAAFDSYLPAFAKLIPPLVQAYGGLPASSPYRRELAEQIAMLRTWDDRWGLDSEATSLAVFWGEDLWKSVEADAKSQGVSIYDYMAERTTAEQKLAALKHASERLEANFGQWRTPWGEINRYQRLTGDIVQPFTDKGPSLPVPFTSSLWGSLASFGAHAYPGTKKYYGTSGNSFVALVEFGEKVRAIAVSTGGESGDPRSPHFSDQAQRYISGDLREVYFYPADLTGHVERTYRPGD